MLRKAAQRCLPALAGTFVLGSALIASGCGGNKLDLNQAAHSLVPPAGRVVAQEPGACVMFAAFPSCETLWFSVRDRSMTERIRLVDENARRRGWSATGSTGGDGGTILEFHKGDLDAHVAIWSALHDYFCRGRHSPTRACVDNLQVVRHG
jgi:hypothetical protein